MNERQYLLLCFEEECLELAHRASKAIRFGESEIHTGQSNSNLERIWDEYCDLIAISELLQIWAGSDKLVLHKKVESKKEKIQKYLKYSQELGIVDSISKTT